MLIDMEGIEGKPAGIGNREQSRSHVGSGESLLRWVVRMASRQSMKNNDEEVARSRSQGTGCGTKAFQRFVMHVKVRHSFNCHISPNYLSLTLIKTQYPYSVTHMTIKQSSCFQVHVLPGCCALMQISNPHMFSSLIAGCK